MTPREAGRDLDALVAEKVMGLQVCAARACAIHVEGEWSIHDDREDAEGWECYAEMAPVYVRHCCCDISPRDWTEVADTDELCAATEDMNRRAVARRASAIARFGHIGHCLCVVPNYSTDIAAAWEVVEKMRDIITRDYPHGRGGLVIQPYHSPQYSGHQWCVANSHAGYNGSWGMHWWVSAATAPLAICLAALQACGASEQPERAS